jgi:hypothetical protein
MESSLDQALAFYIFQVKWGKGATPAGCSAIIIVKPHDRFRPILEQYGVDRHASRYRLPFALLTKVQMYAYRAQTFALGISSYGSRSILRGRRPLFARSSIHHRRTHVFPAT